MAKTKRWTFSDVGDGVGSVTLTSWRYFNDFIDQEMLEYKNYIWRGQRKESWKLESTLDRMLKSGSMTDYRKCASKHLENFKSATRGRRGNNPQVLESDNDWWSLGQHYGLATPLLDWCRSPYLAAFFAFIEAGVDSGGSRVVYALSQSVTLKSKEIEESFRDKGRAPILEVFSPHSNENARLVNQSGLFTRAPEKVDVESWVKKNFAGESKTFKLIKILIPNLDRVLCLKSLNRMNINHLTLFPDLFGAAHFCNQDLLIDGY